MQKYFVRPKDRSGSCYFEFYKGKWDEKTFWKEDSICIDDDDLFECDFIDILIKHVPNYDPFGETEITKNQWEQIKEDCILGGGKSAAIVKEADKWVEDNYSKHSIFTILGL